MNVSTLIALLTTMPQDLEVYSICDHGQSPERSMEPSIAWASELGHTLWDEYTVYEEERDENGYDKQFVLL